MSFRLLSLVVPCYNEESCLRALYASICQILPSLPEGLEVEFRFVDDGSTDGTLSVLKELRAGDPRVHYQSFSRNFGKESALLCGMEAARGDLVAVMDADMQDPPSMLLEMIPYILSGEWECVATRRVDRRGEPVIRSFFARMFYGLMGWLTRVNLEPGARDFRLMTRKYVNALLSMREYNRFSKGLFGWVGFKVKWLPYENKERLSGESKWSFIGLCKYALEGMIGFSTSPLYLSFVLGFLACLFAAIICIKTLVKTLFFGEAVQGYTTILACLTFFSGLQFLLIGVLGLYISKIYMEVKGRPIYLVQESSDE